MLIKVGQATDGINFFVRKNQRTDRRGVWLPRILLYPLFQQRVCSWKGEDEMFLFKGRFGLGGGLRGGESQPGENWFWLVFGF